MAHKSYYEQLIKKINAQKPALYPNGITVPLMVKYARQSEFGREPKRKKKTEEVEA